jgi:hypothetical protein
LARGIFCEAPHYAVFCTLLSVMPRCSPQHHDSSNSLDFFKEYIL